MNIKLILFIVYGSLSHCIVGVNGDEDNVLMESISRYFYPALIGNIKNLYNFRSNDSVTNCTDQFWGGLSSEEKEAYFDSFGKIGAGILTGNYIFLGYYDQCIDIGDTDFCRFPFNVTVTTNSTGGKNYSSPAAAPFEFGMCYPSSCVSANEFYHLVFDPLFNASYTYENYTVTVTVPTKFSEPLCPWTNLKWTGSSLSLLTICILFVALVIIGTLVEVLLWFINDVLPSLRGNVCSEMKPPTSMMASTSCDVKDSVDEDEPLINAKSKLKVGRNRSIAETRCIEFLKDLVLSFSLYKTVPVILSTYQPSNAITSINGIRVISMFWVILGHTFLWGLDYEVTANIKEAVETVPKRFLYQPVNNAFFSVDTFFVLSGLLLSYLGIREMEHRKGKFPFVFFYLHRVLRLSPAYYFVVFFSFKVFPYVGSGPLWYLPDVARCEKYWWTNILYINNFYPTTFADQCYGVTWYLANDMQFFIVSPIFLILLYRYWKVGLVTIASTMLASIVVIGTLAGIKNPDANLLLGNLAGGGEGNPTLQDFAFSNIYEKPYCRINAYLIGIILGFIFYKKWKVTSNQWFHILFFYGALWMIAVAFSATVVFGQYQTWNGDPFNKTENVMYFMFGRTVFSIGIAFMIYACHYGFGGIINSFLSWSFWVPPSRLTFMAYLSHPIVLGLMYSTMRFRFIYTDYMFLMLVVPAVVLSYGLAFAFAVTVEYPLANVESAIYKFAGVKRRK